jgi:hypothetical protein
MRPVKQDRLYSPEGIGNGNCFAACIASLLDIPLWMVPPFDQMFGRNDWRQRVDEWLERMFQTKLVKRGGHFDGHDLPEFYIASGMSPRGVYHSTIYSAGKLVHDPHFSDTGIAAVEWTWHLEPVA